jgi:hypothetical protein
VPADIDASKKNDQSHIDYQRRALNSLNAAPGILHKRDFERKDDYASTELVVSEQAPSFRIDSETPDGSKEDDA